jgi:uncharacterized protein YmfQ (DUF2313 family)
MTVICPTDAESAAALAALRPRGDAWRHGGHDALAGSVMGRVFAALGRATGAMERRICALVEEFFCATADETLDWWRLDYGMPDPCDPFADLCDKVQALGDSTTAYAVAVAARRGWSVTIAEEWTRRAETSRCGIMRAGTARPGAATGVTWAVRISLSASPSYRPPARRFPRAGRLRASQALACGPDTWPIECVLRRIAPAHANITFSLTS